MTTDAERVITLEDSIELVVGDQNGGPQLVAFVEIPHQTQYQTQTQTQTDTNVNVERPDASSDTAQTTAITTADTFGSDPTKIVYIDKNATEVDANNNTGTNMDSNNNKDNVNANANASDGEPTQNKIQTLTRSKGLMNVYQPVTFCRSILCSKFFLRYLLACLVAEVLFIARWLVIKVLMRSKLCHGVRTDPDNIQYQPFPNFLSLSLTYALFVAAFLKISVVEFGVSLQGYWFALKVFLPLVFLDALVCAFVVGSVAYVVYIVVFLWVMFVVAMVLVFWFGGYHTCWLSFPFVMAGVGLCGFAVLAWPLFGPHGFINNESDPTFFSFLVPFYLSFLQYVFLKMLTSCSVPYRRCKFCCLSRALACLTCHLCGRGSLAVAKTDTDLARFSEKGAKAFDFVGDKVQFYLGLVLVTILETMRMSSIVAKGVDRDLAQLWLFVLSSVFSETMQRNNLWSELIYRCICRKENPPLDRLHSIIYANKFQAEYVPILVLALFNVTGYGPLVVDGCTETLSPLVNISDPECKAWWVLIFMFVVGIGSELFSVVVMKIGRCCKVFGVLDENGEDLPRKMIYIKLTLRELVPFTVSCFIVSEFFFNIDHTFRTQSGSPCRA